VADVERFSSLLAEKEEEVRVLKEAQARSAAERTGLEADLGRLKASVHLFCHFCGTDQIKLKEPCVRCKITYLKVSFT
jgi:hypothetical protein